jgi:Ricin-type beta-trefoil lectin domain-like
MATFDPNAWYMVSEHRVDNVTDPLKSNLQGSADNLAVFGKTSQAWQFQPVDGVTGRYLLRTSTSGPLSQLSACFQANEIHPAKTGICLVRSTSDNAQKWDISSWGDGTYKMYNVANGTKYILDVHPGSPPFMNDQIESASVTQPAQHWILTSDRPVNDGAYSTIYSVGPQMAEWQGY